MKTKNDLESKRTMDEMKDIMSRMIGAEIHHERLKREDLERQALEEVCACLYYDLADTVGETSDDNLLSIINHTDKCEMCGN